MELFFRIDRYSLILQIFHKHAMSMEAKLQIQLAELPYLKSRLIGDLELENENKHSAKRRGQEWFDKQRLAIHKREKMIKDQIEKLKAQRAMMRKNRFKTKDPSVAIVGYTNAGKTSLIKAFTGKIKVEFCF